MKFYTLVLFSLLIISDLAFGISRFLKIKIVSPNTVEDLEIIPEEATPGNVPVSYYDFTETISKTVIEILENFHSHISEWTSNKIWFNNGDSFTTSLILKEDDYLVTFSNIFIEEQNIDFPIPNLQKISCEFSNNLKIQMPFRSTRLWLRGDILLHSTTNVTYNESNSFNVYFNELFFSMTTKSDLSNEQMLPNNLTEIVISYKNSTIDMSTNHQTELITTKALGSLIEEIKSKLKTEVEKQLNTFMQKFSFHTLFTTCMQPKNEILRNHQHFATHEQNYYLSIGPSNIDLGDSITLHMDTIKIKGLQNLKSVDIIRDQDRVLPNFLLRIENLTGEFGWKYNSNGNDPLGFKFNSVQFTIDHVTIHGSCGSNLVITHDVEMSPVVITSNSRNTATSLSDKILEKRLLKKIITASITKSWETIFTRAIIHYNI